MVAASAAAAAALFVAAWPASQARATVSLVFTDGDATPTSASIARGGTVTLTLNLVSTAEQTTGLDYYLQSTAPGSGLFSIVDRNIAGSPYNDVYFTDVQVEAQPSALLDPRNDHDLGAIQINPDPPRGAGTHRVAMYTLSLSPTAPNGSFTIQTVSNPGTGWIGAAPSFSELPFDQHATFTVNVVTPQWIRNGGGSWNTAANWNVPPPNSPVAQANFTTALTAPNAPATVTLDGSKQVGLLSFDNTNRYVVAPGTGGTLTIGGGAIGGTIDVVRGSHEVSAPIALASPLNLSIGTDAALKLAGDVTGGKVANLSIGANGKLDLTDNKLIIAGGDVGTVGGGTYSGLTGFIQSAHNGGGWNGSGILTSMPDAVAGLTSLGIATAADTGDAGGTFGGVSVSATDVLVMYTYAGDANLDGAITGDDYSRIDFNIAVPGASGWYNGDFNYDGVISGDDYSVIDFNIAAQGAPFPTGASSYSELTAVPEPAALAIVVLAAAGLIGRQRRSTSTGSLAFR